VVIEAKRHLFCFSYCLRPCTFNTSLVALGSNLKKLPATVLPPVFVGAVDFENTQDLIK